MTQAKKAKPSTVVDKVKVKDSTEIDDLFSVFSSKKSCVTVETASKGAATKHEETKKKLDKKQSDEVTLSDLEGLEDEGEAVSGDESEEDCENDAEVIRGTAYDPKNDYQFPATSTTISSLNDSDFFDSRGLKRKTRALTEDGYPIYTPKELKIGMGGGTDLCPFDCNCCF